MENKFLNKKFRGLVAQMRCQNKNCIDYGIIKMVFLGLGKINFFSEVISGQKCNFCPERKTNTHPDMKFLDIFANRFNYFLFYN